MVSVKDEFDAFTDDPVSYILDYRVLIRIALMIIFSLIVAKWITSTNT
jgi:hypothetical protein